MPSFNATTQTSKSLNLRLQKSFEAAAVLDGLLNAGEVNGINVACAVTRAAKLLVSHNADDGLGLEGGLDGRLERVIRLCERGLGMEEVRVCEARSKATMLHERLLLCDSLRSSLTSCR